MRQWWAARTISGEEYLIKKSLSEHIKDCEIYIPRNKVTNVVDGKLCHKTEKMLPGYVLIATEEPINTGKLNYFINIIGKVTDEEAEHLISAEHKETPKPKSLLGIKIIVSDGPFIGSKGIVISQDKNKIKCRLYFQGIEIFADMDKEYISLL